MGVCMCGGESERGPPCGCAAYMWICGIVCVVAGERERERGGGEGEGGGGETTTTLRQNHSTSTAHQSIDTRSKTLSQQYPSEKIIGVGWIHQT